MGPSRRGMTAIGKSIPMSRTVMPLSRVGVEKSWLLEVLLANHDALGESITGITGPDPVTLRVALVPSVI